MVMHNWSKHYTRNFYFINIPNLKLFSTLRTFLYAFIFIRDIKSKTLCKGDSFKQAISLAIPFQSMLKAVP